MAETKACNLTEREIRILIGCQGNDLVNFTEEVVNEDILERINYLNKRLKAFKEPEVVKTEAGTVAASQPVVPLSTSHGWPTNG